MKYLTTRARRGTHLTKGNTVNAIQASPIQKAGVSVAAADDGPRLTGRVVATALTSPSAAVTYREGREDGAGSRAAQLRERRPGVMRSSSRPSAERAGGIPDQGSGGVKLGGARYTTPQEAPPARTTQLASQEEPWNASGTGSPNHLMDAGSGPGRSRTGLQDTTAPSGWMVGSNLRTVSHGNCIEDRSLLGCSFSTAATIRPASIPSICSSELTRTTWRTCGVRGGVTLRVRINGNARIADVATRSLIPTSATRPTERGAVANVVSQVGAPVIAEQGNRVRTTGPCSDWHSYVRPSMGAEKVHRRVLHTIRCATDRWTVPGGYEMARCIAERESGPSTWPWAYNPSGSTGVFQIIPSTFASWWSAFGVRVKMAHLAHSVWNMRTNVLLSVWAMNGYGLGPWGGGGTCF